MDDIVCQYRFCSGHGDCVNSSANGNITCACESGWTGKITNFVESLEAYNEILILHLCVVLFS